VVAVLLINKGIGLHHSRVASVLYKGEKHKAIASNMALI